jgi:hypothetical protein
LAANAALFCRVQRAGWLSVGAGAAVRYPYRRIGTVPTRLLTVLFCFVDADKIGNETAMGLLTIKVS